jgi:hypothetical protein
MPARNPLRRISHNPFCHTNSGPPKLRDVDPDPQQRAICGPFCCGISQAVIAIYVHMRLAENGWALPIVRFVAHGLPSTSGLGGRNGRVSGSYMSSFHVGGNAGSGRKGLPSTHRDTAITVMLDK